jgi:2-(1,2-epoxy-1,2-dihydrophenyl)acetyl-CoA isomerase
VDFDTIDYSVADGVARLTLNRPEAGNGVNVDLARELMHAAMACGEDPRVRAVLLRGAGRNFCVGGDLRAFSAEGDKLPLHLKEVTTYLHSAVSRLARLDAPVVAAVQGSAAGAGFSLACAADLVVAAASAKFVVAYTKIGLNLDGSGSWFLPRIVGVRRAADLALTNRVLTAADAEGLGIVTRVVGDDALDDESGALAADLAHGPTAAIGAVKRLLASSLDNTLETQMEMETRAIVESARHADAVEGMSAFLEKRVPRFTGR